jgi:hypothetical protein
MRNLGACFSVRRIVFSILQHLPLPEQESLLYKAHAHLPEGLGKQEDIQEQNGRNQGGYFPARIRWGFFNGIEPFQLVTGIARGELPGNAASLRSASTVLTQARVAPLRLLAVVTRHCARE